MLLYLDDLNLMQGTTYATQEREERVNLRSTVRGGGSCSPSGGSNIIESREFVFDVYCLGHGSLNNAKVARDAIDNKLASSPIVFARKVDDETAQAYTVLSGYTRTIKPETQYICERIIAIELSLKVKDGLDASLTLPKLPGISFDMIIKPAPVFVSVSVVDPVVSVPVSIAVAAIAITTNVPAPTVLNP